MLPNNSRPHNGLGYGIRDSGARSIFQKFIEKSEEIRVFVFGENIYQVSVMSVGTSDSRKSERFFCLPKIPLSDYEIDLVKQLMSKLKLRTASIDFLRDKFGNLVFLEINEAGQWAFIELALPQFQILNSFCDFLLQRPFKSESHQQYNPIVSMEDAHSNIWNK